MNLNDLIVNIINASVIPLNHKDVLYRVNNSLYVLAPNDSYRNYHDKRSRISYRLNLLASRGRIVVVFDIHRRDGCSNNYRSV